MRSDEEVYQLIVEIAKGDERVRAVGMNGSRLNDTIKADVLQDFDIVYFVTEIASFLEDANWIDQFGKRVIMQTPEDSALFPAELAGCFTYLMLFEDGHRIDLMLRPLAQVERWIEEDRLAMVLYDKDERIPTLPAPSDCTFWVARPSAKQFRDCCNEFWWLTTYVAKGLWRDQPIYAYDHLQLVRDMLLQMIAWKVGSEHHFAVSIGKNASKLPDYIEGSLWQAYLQTYPRCDGKEIQAALHHLMTLFSAIAREVAAHFPYHYDEREELQVRRYVQRLLKSFEER